MVLEYVPKGYEVDKCELVVRCWSFLLFAADSARGAISISHREASNERRRKVGCWFESSSSLKMPPS